MSKVILVIDVKDKDIDKHGIKFAMEQGYSSDELVVEEAIDYPFDDVFRTDYLSVLQDTEVVLSSVYGEKYNKITKEQLLQITKEVADEISEGLVAEETNNVITDTAKRILKIKED
jgi:hypothetical protein